jgi:hypothetical protein
VDRGFSRDMLTRRKQGFGGWPAVHFKCLTIYAITSIKSARRVESFEFTRVVFRQNEQPGFVLQPRIAKSRCATGGRHASVHIVRWGFSMEVCTNYACARGAGGRVNFLRHAESSQSKPAAESCAAARRLTIGGNAEVME